MLISSSANVLDAQRSTPTPSFAAGGDLHRLQRQGVLRVGIVGDVPGLNWTDPVGGKRSGLDVGLARLATQSLFGGTVNDACNHVEFVEVDMPDRITACADGRVDITVAVLTATDERRRTVDFSDPYFGAHLGLATRKGDGQRDLQSARIAVVATSTSEAFVRESRLGSEIVVVDRHSDLPRMVDEGVADVAITSSAIIDSQLRSAYPQLERSMQSFHFEPWSIAMPKGSDELRQFLNATLAQVVDEGWLITAARPACE